MVRPYSEYVDLLDSGLVFDYLSSFTSGVS
jgi:hypothetical protein